MYYKRINSVPDKMHVYDPTPEDT